VSVVVPTHRRADGLRRCCDGLARQRPPWSWEVVVVDNAPAAGGRPSAGVATAVEELRAARPELDVRAEVEPTVGAAAARNRGIAVARGGVVAMVDDDVVPADGWLEAICAPLLAGRAAGAGGRVELDRSARQPGWFDERAVGGYFTSHDLGPEAHALDYVAEPVVTANAAFTTAVLRAVGGFDPGFGPRGRDHAVADDAHLTRQVIAFGETVLWCPDAVVVHALPAERLRLRWLLGRAWWQGRSDWRLERLELTHRRLGGRWAGVVQVARWLRQELTARVREGLQHRSVQVHLACDVVRMAGRLREVVLGVPGGSASADGRRRGIL
jgi:glycosyltransferase involved in cell wall biosynthesis